MANDKKSLYDVLLAHGLNSPSPENASLQYAKRKKLTPQQVQALEEIADGKECITPHRSVIVVPASGRTDHVYLNTGGSNWLVAHTVDGKLVPFAVGALHNS